MPLNIPHIGSLNAGTFRSLTLASNQREVTLTVQRPDSFWPTDFKIEIQNQISMVGRSASQAKVFATSNGLPVRAVRYLQSPSDVPEEMRGVGPIVVVGLPGWSKNWRLQDLLDEYGHRMQIYSVLWSGRAEVAGNGKK